ncbi:D-2-hydroxyacid dehydrogenase [Bacillus shivajii]|uniref:D-2-hydroxyacid dehydrogenase n=1 Tax=Bacillus shivajii TaxID=1983719 RepID=UPI001CFB6FED|nr:D-2-hydroxyacid dehydrogenase [Bacillus shivajii]UCZ53134.1 D-2-hydroxyacid dehydrogenase [Bacillus shivajii]
MILVTLDDIKKTELEKLNNICHPKKLLYVTSLEEVPQKAFSQIEIIITYGEELSSNLIAKMPNLRWIQLFQSGTERLPFQALKDQHITLTNMKTIHAVPMSEYALGMMLRHTLQLERLNQNQLDKYWDSSAMIDEIYQKTVTIFGAGEVGSAIAEKCHLMGMNVIGVNRSGKLRPHFNRMVTLSERDTVIPESDFIILTMPVTTNTKKCFATKEFDLMKENALFINLGRAPLIDEQALKTVLLSNKIGGAVLDVFHQEPLHSQSELWGIKNLFITPHVAAKSPHYISRCLNIFENQYRAYVNNEPLQFKVDLHSGY